MTGFGTEQGIYPAATFLVPEPSAGLLAVLLGLCVAPLVRRSRRRKLAVSIQPRSSTFFCFRILSESRLAA